mmetsp:Transcript_8674/g.19859  ORF Transcript_8674/g.19859 Transcript_8674/m.19859 type:complete len:311 (+) Transcript_8674:455-1387(+)
MRTKLHTHVHGEAQGNGLAGGWLPQPHSGVLGHEVEVGSAVCALAKLPVNMELRLGEGCVKGLEEVLHILAFAVCVTDGSWAAPHHVLGPPPRRGFLPHQVLLKHAVEGHGCTISGRGVDVVAVGSGNAVHGPRWQVVNAAMHGWWWQHLVAALMQDGDQVHHAPVVQNLAASHDVEVEVLDLDQRLARRRGNTTKRADPMHEVVRLDGRRVVSAEKQERVRLEVWEGIVVVEVLPMVPVTKPMCPPVRVNEVIREVFRPEGCHGVRPHSPVVPLHMPPDEHRHAVDDLLRGREAHGSAGQQPGRQEARR